MTVDEMMARQDDSDRMEIGNIVEHATQGRFGKVLKAIIEGIKEDLSAAADRDPKISAERTLGKIWGLNEVQRRLDNAVDDKNKIIQSRAAELLENEQEKKETKPQIGGGHII